MKEIKLIPDAPFYNRVDVHVMDFPTAETAKKGRDAKLRLNSQRRMLTTSEKEGWDLPRRWNIIAAGFMTL